MTRSVTLHAREYGFECSALIRFFDRCSLASYRRLLTFKMRKILDAKKHQVVGSICVHD